MTRGKGVARGARCPSGVDRFRWFAEAQSEGSASTTATSVRTAADCNATSFVTRQTPLRVPVYFSRGLARAAAMNPFILVTTPW